MFQTSTPVVGAGFLNRVPELEALARAMRQLSAGKPQWVAILGTRKIGKTSLVLEAARRVKQESLRVVALDLQELGPVSLEIFRRLTLRVLDAAVGNEVGESLERLVRQPALYRKLLQKMKGLDALPASLRVELNELVEGPATPDRVGFWLDVPEELAVARALKFVIALDEFQALGGLEKPAGGFEPFSLLRSKWQKHRHVAYFVSGSERSLLTRLITAERSPFFQHFSIRELNPFEPKSAVELLCQLSPPDHPIPAEVAEMAVLTLDGHPFYLQLLGEQLTEIPGPVDVAALKSALQALLFSRTGRLALFFENEFQRLVGRSLTLAATLDALAEGPMTFTAVANAIKASSGPTVSYLERLADAVSKADGCYSLADPVFALWLRWRRPGGTIVPMTVIGDEAEKAVAIAFSRMGLDIVYQSLGSRGPFDLLATRGPNQLGVQVKRSPLPLRFSRAAWARMEAEAAQKHWRWVVISVGSKAEITILDPAKATIRKEAVLKADAEIHNLLKWLDSRAKADS